MIDKENIILEASQDDLVVSDCCEIALLKIKRPARGKGLALDHVLKKKFLRDRVKLGEDLVSGNIEKLFEETRRNTKIQQDRWAKYYNRRGREVDVKVKDLVLVQTHPMSSASKRIVSKFKPKFVGTFEVMKVENNNVAIWKGGKLITVNIDQVRIYHSRERDEGVVETDG
ncbi:uncharacterized protein NPIL_504851 [Nephila pilipes]|uniref:Uncharacterized protein n=1 Tax=Nephila pilipes TaxID=299642 RepID=A0A8X6P7P5_NEPPI|nr:uncharacterized protein NPIL_504851 [Nephila pilipes]